MLSAFDKICALKDTMKIFCGHEYTLSNYEYAKKFDIKNSALDEQIALQKHDTENGLYSIPSTVYIEKQTNVFMQC